MKIKTNIEVSCNLQGKATPTQAVVVGELGTKVIRTEGIEVGFKYITETGEPVVQNSTIYSWIEVNILWETIKDSIPVDSSFEELLDKAFLSAFKIEMSKTFNILITDIVEIN